MGKNILLLLVAVFNGHFHGFTERKSGHGYKGFKVYAAPEVTLASDRPVSAEYRQHLEEQGIQLVLAPEP